MQRVFAEDQADASMGKRDIHGFQCLAVFKREMDQGEVVVIAAMHC